MPIEIPKADKTYTTVYDNFKGVDYTNDATNIYKRRTPSGVNMIPDLGGKPYKRTGWEIAVSEEMLAEAYGEELDGGFSIYKIHYFEMEGCDHIILFTTTGLFAYRADGDDVNELKFLSDDATLKECYDRAFFFEANGGTGFYIYGNYSVWKYCYDEESGMFVLNKETPTIPRIRIAVSADGSKAEAFESNNLLTNMVAEQFQNNIIGTNQYMTYLVSNVPTENYKDVKVFASDSKVTGQFGTELTVINSGTPSATQARLETVTIDGEKRTRLVYSIAHKALVDGEDAIKVIYPSKTVQYTEHLFPVGSDHFTVSVKVGGGS